MEKEILKLAADYGAVILLGAFFIYKVFDLLKNGKKKNGNGAIVDQLKLMNSNHLNSIKTAIKDEGEKIRKEISNGNSLLSEIKGILSSK